jgi:hypothetical protein
MSNSALRKAVRIALKSSLKPGVDQEAALTQMGAELLQLLGSGPQDVDTVALLAVVREEVMRARLTRH